MTISQNDRRIQYTATAGQTIFPYDFKILESDEIEVKQTIKTSGVTNTLTLTTDYTVSNVGTAGGGNITLVTGAAVDDIITLTGITSLDRNTDFNNSASIDAVELNNQLDKITQILQEESTVNDRSIKLKNEDTSSTLEIPTKADRANKFLSFDVNGNAIAAEVVDTATVSSFASTLLDDTSQSQAQSTLGLVIGNDVQADVVTTRGDLVYGNSSGDAARLALGAANQILQSNGTDLIYADLLEKVTITISNGTDTNHDIDFSSGTFQFDDRTGLANVSALTKQIDNTWVAGDNQGGLDTGTVAADTPYYMFAIHNPTSKVSDFLFSASKTSPTMPTGYTKKKYIACLLTDGSGNIRNGIYSFNPDGSYNFKYLTAILEVDGSFSTSTTTAVSTPPLVFSLLGFKMNINSDGNIDFYSNVVGSSNSYNMQNDWSPAQWSGGYNDMVASLLVDANSNIGVTVHSPATGDIKTHGWFDNIL